MTIRRSSAVGIALAQCPGVQMRAACRDSRRWPGPPRAAADTAPTHQRRRDSGRHRATPRRQRPPLAGGHGTTGGARLRPPASQWQGPSATGRAAHQGSPLADGDAAEQPGSTSSVRSTPWPASLDTGSASAHRSAGTPARSRSRRIAAFPSTLSNGRAQRKDSSHPSPAIASLDAKHTDIERVDSGHIDAVDGPEMNG